MTNIASHVAAVLSAVATRKVVNPPSHGVNSVGYTMLKITGERAIFDSDTSSVRIDLADAYIELEDMYGKVTVPLLELVENVADGSWVITGK